MFRHAVVFRIGRGELGVSFLRECGFSSACYAIGGEGKGITLVKFLGIKVARGLKM